MFKNWYLLSAGLFTIFLSIISLRESDNLPDLEIPFLDKAFHFFAYIVLTILWSKYVSLQYFKTKTNIVFTILGVVLTIYGIIIEVLQINLTTTRTMEISDMIANLLGIVFGIFIFKFINKYKLNSN